MYFHFIIVIIVNQYDQYSGDSRWKWMQEFVGTLRMSASVLDIVYVMRIFLLLIRTLNRHMNTKFDCDYFVCVCVQTNEWRWIKWKRHTRHD